MQAGSIAKRYARAMIDLARESGQVEAVLKELENFEGHLRQSSALTAVMTNPSFSAQDRVGVLKELLATLQYSDLTGRFLLLVAAKRRMDVFDSILREFRNYYDDLNGLVRVTMSSAVPLPAEVERALVDKLESMVRRKVILTKEVEPKIIGGVITRVGGLLIDGSVATQLARMKTALLHEQLS